MVGKIVCEKIRFSATHECGVLEKEKSTMKKESIRNALEIMDEVAKNRAA